MLHIDPDPEGRITRGKWKTITGKPDPRCDPYLVWFDLTHLPDAKDKDKGVETASMHGAADGKRKGRRVRCVDILLELPDAEIERAERARDYLSKLCSEFDIVRRTEFVANGLVQKFVCGSLPIDRLFELSEVATKDSKGIRFELASARNVTEQDRRSRTQQFLNILGRAPGLGNVLRKKREDQHDLDWNLPKPLLNSGRWLAIAEQAERWSKGNPPKAPLVVVVDDFCNHASLALAGRVRTIWHQGRRYKEPDTGGRGAQGAGTGKPAHPPLPPELDPDREVYGQVQDVRRESPVARGGQAPPDRSDECHRYERPDPEDPRSRIRPPPVWSHGSAVLSMLVREGTRFVPETSPDGLDALKAPPDIDFVQLPDDTVIDTSGGSLCGYALDAIHRALRLASYRDPRGAVIVNLSFGTHSGPHDGTSMFERALLELLRHYNGNRTVKDPAGDRTLPALHVVLPAGNTHAERVHASGLLQAQERPSDLLWMIQPDGETDSFLEIWLDEHPDSSQVSIELLPPAGGATVPVNDHERVLQPGDVKVWRDPALDVLHAAVIYPRTTSKGQHGRMALVAVAPTQHRANFGQGERAALRSNSMPKKETEERTAEPAERVRMQAAPGCWTVRLTNTGTQPVRFHAWIQRHDAAPGRRRAGKGYQGRQSYFVDAQGTHVDPRFTINGIATAKYPGQLWVVGAMDERGRIPVYSAAGPDRLFGERIDGPDVSAVVDRSRNMPGRHVHGVFSGSRLRMGGTSIGAAVFTRMLYHTLERGGTMAWCTPDKLPPPPLKPDGVTELAEDWMRGSNQRLRHKNDLAVSTPSCEDRHRTADAPGSCKP